MTPAPRKTFTSAAGQEPVAFEIDGDEFLVRPTAPAQWLIDFVDDIEEHGVPRAMVRFFDRVLLGETAELFADRLRSPDRPLDLHTLNQVFEWLTGEVYGLRPTGSSASSWATNEERAYFRGRCLLAGLGEPAQLDLSQMLDVAWAVLTEGMTAEQRREFYKQLTRPPIEVALANSRTDDPEFRPPWYADDATEAALARQRYGIEEV